MLAYNGLPVITIHSPEPAATPPANTAILCSKLRDALVRFDEINVVYDVPAVGSVDLPNRESGDARATQYDLFSSSEVQPAGAVLRLKLVNATERTIVWSQTCGPYQLNELDEQSASVAQDAAIILAQPLGVIHAHERGKGRASDARYASVIAAFDYLVGMFDDPGADSPDIHVNVRAGLERAIEMDRSFVAGFALLTWIYLREHYDMALARPADLPALDRALHTAQRAVALKPQSSRAHEAAFVAYFARGEIDAAFAEAETAMSLNPIDPFVISAYGRRLVSVGKLSAGVPLLKIASAKSAVKAAWLDFFLFLASYLDGDLASATRYATLDMSGLHPLGLVARALVAAASGDRDQAQQMINRLVTSFPNWRDDPLRAIGKFIPSSEIASRLLSDLDDLGLRATHEREVVDQARSTERALDLIVGVTAAASAANSESDVTLACVDQICRLQRWQFGQVWYPHSGCAVLTCSTYSQAYPDRFATFRNISESLSLAKGQDLPGRVWSSKAPVLLVDLTEHGSSERAKAARMLGFKTAFGFPVIFDDKILAVFEFYSTGWNLPDRASIDAFKKLGSFLGDVFIRKRTELELLASEKRWRSILDNPIFGISVLDDQQHFVTTNETFQTMLGYSSDELRHLTLLDISLDTDREMNKVLFKELQQGKRQHYEMIKQLKRRDGTEVWMQLYLFALMDEVSGLQRIFIMNLDITDHKQAQDGLEEARTELARVGRINRMGIMAASIAHEIKQPLAAITAQAAAGLRWLGRAVPDLDETRVALQHIVRDGQRAAETVEGIRAMFKEERRSLGAIDLNQLVRDVLVLAREEIQKRLIVVETNLTDNLPPVWGDRVQLQQVMFNLVINAADSMDSVSDRPRVLRLKSELDGSGVIVAVEDSGNGIAPENIDRIFDTFFTTKPQGMGMGLSICRSIIESYAGRLSVLPSYQGAIFQVALPVDVSERTFQTH